MQCDFCTAEATFHEGPEFGGRSMCDKHADTPQSELAEEAMHQRDIQRLEGEPEVIE